MNLNVCEIDKGLPETQFGFDREDFRETLTIDVIIVRALFCSSVLRKLKNTKKVLRMNGVKCIRSCENNSDRKMILLDPSWRISSNKSEIINDLRKGEQEGERLELDFDEVKVEIGYDTKSYEEVVTELFRKRNITETPPLSFEAIGHIAHFNLKDAHLPVRNIIGQMILDKYKCISLVCNKVEVISGIYRNPKLEILAKREDSVGYVTVVREHGITLKLDYSDVYWNSRLCSERLRLVSYLRNRQSQDNRNICVVDMCCGIGAFVCHCAISGISVICNDLNEKSVYWCQKNFERNCPIAEFLVAHFTEERRVSNKSVQIPSMEKIIPTDFQIKGSLPLQEYILSGYPQTTVSIYNYDAQEFIRKIRVALLAPKEYHFYMNLPSIAISLLRVFVGLFRNTDYDISSAPEEEYISHKRFRQKRRSASSECELISDTGFSINKSLSYYIHVHCFCREPQSTAMDVLLKELNFALRNESGCEIRITDVAIHHVRDVAPNKFMYCLEFELPREILFAIPN